MMQKYNPTFIRYTPTPTIPTHNMGYETPIQPYTPHCVSMSLFKIFVT